MNKYNPQKIERHWQKYWQDNSIFKVEQSEILSKVEGSVLKKPKFYALDMFPYPSGSGLHVGHPKGYIATDVVARYKMLNGYNVLHPMGFDSFGLPAENYAIKNKIHPSIAVNENIKRYKKQLEMFGFTYDWDRQIITSDPDYYKWTQWIFLQMFKKGLAYQSNEPINWCPSCKTGLANEDLEDGKCERCGSEVEKKPLRQWVLKITDYAERLLDDLKLVDWEDSIIEMQKNWIGRSEGALVRFATRINSDKKSARISADLNQCESAHLEVFTTRPDTLFGATFMVICPEHELITNYKLQIINYKEIEKYTNKTKNKSELERTDLAKNKTGVEIKGIKVVNPANNEEIPIFVADYVLPNYGTGAIMAVPAHDARDWEFAKKYHLPIKNVIEPKFVSATGDDAVKEGLPFIKRNNVCVILHNSKNDKYLCISWKNFNMHGLITGGVENNEDMIKTALREIHEETGYKNVRFVKNPNIIINTFFYQRIKKENRWARFHYLFFELENEDQDPVEEKEAQLHEVMWKKKSELKIFFTVMEGDFIVDFLDKDELVYIDEGILSNSGKFDGMDSEKAKDEITRFVGGKKTIQYKLNDWVFSRQRYWGEPFPLVFCENCAEKIKNLKLKIKNCQFSKGELANPGWIGISEDRLPVELPKVDHYEPTGTGESPLANIKDWVNTTCPKCGGPAKRETNTMPQWAGSSWYYLRYCDSKNDKQLANSDKLKYWLEPKGVDLYVGGAEHATRHLIYARFWHKFLYDIGVVTTKEPFYRLQHVGLINGEDGRKMSKRWGNVINPDDVIKEFGADALRCYEMFMGPFADSIAWNTQGVKGVYRFLDKLYNLSNKFQITNTPASPMLRGASKSQINYKFQNPNYKSNNILINQTIKKVTEDIEDFRFNTAISTLMILVNKMSDQQEINRDDYQKLLQLLSPFAPHLAEELWHKFGHKESIFQSQWPIYDKNKIKLDIMLIPVQINGKIRAKIEAESDCNQEQLEKIALQNENVKKCLAGKKIKKIIYITNKILSIVI